MINSHFLKKCSYLSSRMIILALLKCSKYKNTHTKRRAAFGFLKTTLKRGTKLQHWCILCFTLSFIYTLLSFHHVAWTIQLQHAACLAADEEQKEKRQQGREECGTLFYHPQLRRKMISLFVYIYVIYCIMIMSSWTIGLEGSGPSTQG